MKELRSIPRAHHRNDRGKLHFWEFSTGVIMKGAMMNGVVNMTGGIDQNVTSSL